MAIRRLLLLMLVLFLQPASRLASAREAQVVTTRLRVEIVFDGPPLPAKLEASVMKELRLIWAPYGVDIRASSVSSGVRPDGPIRLGVTLVERELEGSSSEALGSILFAGDVPQPKIAMYPKAVGALVYSMKFFGRNGVSWPMALRDLVAGRVLGRALAHEVGHFLLRTRHHSPAGLMRALQPAVYLVDANRGHFGLSSGEVARLVSNTSTLVQAAPPANRPTARLDTDEPTSDSPGH